MAEERRWKGACYLAAGDDARWIRYAMGAEKGFSRIYLGSERTFPNYV